MALINRDVGVARDEPEDSGSGVGGILGAILGAAAAIVTGGAALPAVFGAASTGATVGSAVGSAVKPGKAGEAETAPVGPQVTNQASQKAANAVAPLGENSRILKDSIEALAKAPEPIRQEYSKPLMDSFALSVANDIKAFRNSRTGGDDGFNS